MKLAVEFPSVAYREGPQAVVRLAEAIEEIGFDQLDMFDHVVMGHPTESRGRPIYPPEMPIMEALMVLSYAAAVTEKIGLGTEVLVLPQRQPVLVAKQISTLDTLSGGRVRLGVGVGWQDAEYDALEQEFGNRGARMDEAIDLIRAYWAGGRVDYQGSHYSSDAMAMEPPSPQGAKLPIWIGGMTPRALKRVAEKGDGWLATALTRPEKAEKAVATIRHHAESIGRDPASIGLQQMLDVPPQDEQGKSFYKDLDLVEARAVAVQEMGFQWGTLNATAIFQSGARSVDAIIDTLDSIHDRLRSATGPAA